MDKYEFDGIKGKGAIGRSEKVRVNALNVPILSITAMVSILASEIPTYY